jgi:hypothetical protein
MALFKSREERRIEREMAARKGVASFKRQIAQQEKHEREYLKKAARAKQLGDTRMLETLKAQIKRTHAMRYRFERSLLLLETAMQSKDQIESFESFGKAMSAISKSIDQAYGVTNLVKTQKEYEQAMAKASSMEQRIDLFLESSMDAAVDVSDEEAGMAMSDADLDRLIGEAAGEAEAVGADDEIEKGLKDIERELGRDK